MMTERKIHPAVQMQHNFWKVAKWRKLDSYGMAPTRVQPDRVWCLLEPERCDVDGILRRFDQLELTGDLQPQPAKLHKVPKHLLELWDADSSKRWRSWRGRFPKTLGGDQWVIHQLYRGEAPGRYVVEMDIDPESPVDIAGFVPHIAMVIRNTWKKHKTNPFETAELLKEAGIA